MVSLIFAQKIFMEMKTVYQPEIKQYTEDIIEDLKNVNFFVDNEINDFEFTKKYICDFLTQKFITTGLNVEEGFFTDEEFGVMLKEIIVGSLFYSMKEKGYLNSYEDEETDETFFLTDIGREYLKSKDDM